MRKLLLAACLSVLAVTQVHANDTSAKTGKPLTDQQQKMKDCSGDAKSKGLKGADRKSFMKECLSKGGAAPAAAPAADAAAATDKKAAQREKMKTCNADAKSKGLKGDDRKAFMKTCLSGA